MEIDQIKKIIEGTIFAADEPLTRDRIASVFPEDERPDPVILQEAIESLQEDYADRGIELREIASGFTFRVRQELAAWVKHLWHERPPRYSRAMLETLALIIYRQPITRGEIEAVRGVAVSSHIIRVLLDHEWIKIVGHRDVPGRPALLATTKKFLDYFNLCSLNDLPPLPDLQDLDKVGDQLEMQLKEVTHEDPKTDEPLENTIDEVDTIDEPNQINEINEINKVDEVIEADQIGEINEADEIDETNEVDPINESSESHAIDRNFKDHEADNASFTQEDTHTETID